jgi:hypothetical protein
MELDKTELNEAASLMERKDVGGGGGEKGGKEPGKFGYGWRLRT